MAKVLTKDGLFELLTAEGALDVENDIIENTTRHYKNIWFVSSRSKDQNIA